MAKQRTILVRNRLGRLEAIAEQLDQSRIGIRAFTIQARATTSYCG